MKAAHPCSAVADKGKKGGGSKEVDQLLQSSTNPSTRRRIDCAATVEATADAPDLHSPVDEIRENGPTLTLRESLDAARSAVLIGK